MSVRLVLVAVAAAGALAAAAGAGEPARAWQIHDLGTLGGPGSAAVAVNEAGDVVGWAETARRSSSGVYPHHAFLWHDGTMIDLGTLGGSNSEAVALNEAGQVVGVSDTSRTGRFGVHLRHAFLWHRGEMLDLGTLGGPNSAAAAINATGQVVGRADTGRRDSREPEGSYVERAFLWDGRKMVDLGTLGGAASSASAISDRGTIVGTSDTGRGAWDASAFKWRQGRMYDLHFPGPPLLTPGDRIARAFGKLSPHGVGYAGGTALALNEHGDTAGYCARYVRGEVPAQPCAWLHGKPTTLGLLRHGFRGRALDLNDKDQIVGRTGIGPPSGKNHAFLWQQGRMTDLGGLRPNDWSVAVGITDNGLIVGYSRRTTRAAPHAVIWTPSP